MVKRSPRFRWKDTVVAALLGCAMMSAVSPPVLAQVSPPVKSQVGPNLSQAPDIARLIQQLKSPDVETRHEATMALGGLADRDDSSGLEDQLQAAIPQLIINLRQDVHPPIRIHSALALGTIGAKTKTAKQVVPALLQALQDPDRRVQSNAIVALGEMGPEAKDALPALLTLGLNTPPGIGSVYTLEILGRIDPQGQIILPGLFQALQNPQPRVRVNAIIALSHLPSSILFNMAKSNARTDTQSTGERTIIGSLDQLILPLWRQIEPRLITALRDPDGQVRGAAVDALLGVRTFHIEVSKAAIPTLTLLLEDPDRAVQVSAISALNTLDVLDSQEALRRLEPSVNNPNAEVRMRAAAGIADLRGRKPLSPSNGVVEQLFGLLQDPNPLVRGVTVLALGRLNPNSQQLLPKLIPMLNDAQLTVKLNTIQVIKRLGARAKPAVPKLLEILKTASSEGFILNDLILDTLTQLGPAAKSAVPDLLILLKNRDNSALLGPEIMGTLLEIGVEADFTVPQLVAMLHDSSAAMQSLALHILVQKQPESLSQLPEPLSSILQARFSSREQSMILMELMNSNVNPRLSAVVQVFAHRSMIFRSSAQPWEDSLLNLMAASALLETAPNPGSEVPPRNAPMVVTYLAKTQIEKPDLGGYIALINQGLQQNGRGDRLVSALFLASLVESWQSNSIDPTLPEKSIQLARQQLAKADVKTAIATLDDALKGFEDGRYKEMAWKGNVARLLTALKHLKDSRAHRPTGSP
jgi:HEAT repeat protein